MIGKTISHYRILEMLGEGGMGVVYRAEDTKLKRTVALKFLAPHAVGGHEDSARFIHEAQAAASLAHPNICHVYEIDESEGHVFIAMQCVDGESLRAKIDAGPLGLDEALGLAIQIAEGLQEAHEAGVVHRDIKPANIMITLKGQAKIMDFGLAKSASGRALTKTGTTVGTVAYMSPEQARGEDVDGRTDIWSLGALLYEMVSGRRPFKSDYEQAVVYAILNEEPPPLTSLRSGVPLELDRVVDKALEKNREDRYAHIEDMIVDLRRIRRSLGAGAAGRELDAVSLREPAAGEPGRPNGARDAAGRRRRRLVTAGAAGFMSIALVAAGIWYAGRNGVDLEKDRVVVDIFENRTGDPSLDPIGRMAADWITQGLAQTKLVSVVPSNVAQSALQGQVAGGRTKALAEATGSRIVVSGAYYREKDGLSFSSQITDARSGDVLSAIEPVTGSLENPVETVELLRQKVLGAMATAIDERLSRLSGFQGDPPTYDAYLEYLQGFNSYMAQEYRESIVHLRRAAGIDTTSTLFLFPLAVAYLNIGEPAQADSVAGLLERSRDRLARYDSFQLDFLQARLRGDKINALHASRRAAALIPKSPMQFQWGAEALRSNRPREAIKALSPLTDSALAEWDPLWYYLGFAYHALGEYERELRLGERAREERPGKVAPLFVRLRALCALGKVEDVRGLLEESQTFPRHPSWGGPEALFWLAVRELRAHGYHEEAGEVDEMAINWLSMKAGRESGTREERLALARFLMAAERRDEARAVLLGPCREETGDLDCLGYRGVLAVADGEPEEAAMILDLLDAAARPYAFGGEKLWEARIAAARGDRERAVMLLRGALSEGTSYMDLHADFFLEPLSDYAPFRKLIAPSG